MQSMLRPPVLGSLVLLASACGPRQSAEQPEPRYPRDLASHMSEHFVAAMDLETAVIRGDVAEGRIHAEWLSEHEPHRDLPGATGPHTTAVQAAADRGAQAEGLEALAAASASMASACGGCHSTTRGPADYIPQEPPMDTESVSARMARHVWAADRLWEALVRHSDDLWDGGARVLQASAVSGREASWEPSVVAAIRPIVAQVEGIATQAGLAGEWSERAELVGSLLTTCSRCHEAVGIDPLGHAGIGMP